MSPIAKRPIGRTGLEVTTLGIGSAPLGGMFQAVAMDDAVGMLAEAWARGVRYFDTAPMYGLGRAELVVGHALRRALEAQGDDDGRVVSTKVGRLMIRERPGRPLPPRPPRNRLDPGWRSALNFEEVFDYSYDGIMRSFDDSSARLGLPRIDILYVHDIGRLTHGPLHEHHWGALTAGGGFRALGELRGAGLIKAVGVGVNEWEAVRDAIEAFDIDCCLLAGRYTLLDQTSLAELMPLCERRGVSVVAAAPFNSGILAASSAALAKYNYADAPPEIVAKVERIRGVCREHGVALQAAALQFPLAHPAVATVMVGSRTPAEFAEIADWMAAPVPAELWTALAGAGLIAEGAPLPRVAAAA